MEEARTLKSRRKSPKWRWNPSKCKKKTENCSRRWEPSTKRLRMNTSITKSWDNISTSHMMIAKKLTKESTKTIKMGLCCSYQRPRAQLWRPLRPRRGNTSWFWTEQEKGTSEPMFHRRRKKLRSSSLRRWKTHPPPRNKCENTVLKESLEMIRYALFHYCYSRHKQVFKFYIDTLSHFYQLYWKGTSLAIILARFR